MPLAECILKQVAVKASAAVIKIHGTSNKAAAGAHIHVEVQISWRKPWCAVLSAFKRTRGHDCGGMVRVAPRPDLWQDERAVQGNCHGCCITERM